MKRSPAQLDLRMNAHGGKRTGAGRPRTSRQVSHRTRPWFDGAEQPVHITVRMAKGVWNLRSERGFRCVELTLEHERDVGELRVVHFSVQGNHIHLVAEADDPRVLSRSMQRFGIRLARRLNAMMGRRRGRVVGDRYFARALTSRRDGHRVIRYVLLNHLHHGTAAEGAGPADWFSSSRWFPLLVEGVPRSAGPPSALLGVRMATTKPPTSVAESSLTRLGRA